MKQNLIDYFANHPTGANLLMVFLILLGAIALPELNRETFPDFSIPIIQVTVVYQGASPEDIESSICQPLQDAIDGISNVEEIQCAARDGLGTLTVEWSEDGDFDEFMEDVKTEVEAITSFPEQAESPIIKQIGRTDRVVSIAITGPMAIPHLKSYAESVKDRLQLTGISLVDIDGFSDHQIRIELSSVLLQQYGLSVSGVANVIRNQSLNLPVGSVETRNRDVLIRFMDERRTPQEFESLIVLSNESGAEIRLGDIAKITDRFEQDEVKTTFNGQRAAILHVNKTKAEDALEIGSQLVAFVDELRKTAPPGVELNLTGDAFSVIRDRLNLLVSNGVQGFILVVLVLWMFFSLRFAFWVAMGLPVSFMGTFFFMNWMGQSLNMITMVGLLIALGLLMDDAIVIAENIATQLNKGKSALEAAAAGTKEVGLGVFSSFLTTICMFGPLIFLEGTIGKILRVLPIVLILTLLVSLLEAFFILPQHLGHSLAHQISKVSRLRQRFENFIQWLREEIAGKAVDWAVAWRYLFLGLLLAGLIISIGMLAGGHIKVSPFPDTEGDSIEARLLLPQGTPLARTEAIVTQLTEAISQINETDTPLQPEGQSLIKSIRVDYNQNVDANESGPHLATVFVDLLGAEQRVGRVDDLLQRWRETAGNLPDILSLKFTSGAAGPAGVPIDIKIQGADFEELKQASLELQDWLNQYDGVLDLSDDLRAGKWEIRLSVKEGALALGLDANTIASQLRAAYLNSTADEVRVGSESYEVDVRLQDMDRNSLADLEYFTVTTQSGQQIPLNTVAHITMGRGYASLKRIDGLRTITVQGDIDPSQLNTNDLNAALQQDFLPKFQERFPGLKLTVGGENEEGSKTQASIVQAFILGFLGIFFLLSFQFRSYIEPLTIMLAIPMSLIGVIWGHWIMGLEITMPSMMGFVSLAGIVVNDSILLISFLKQHVEQGETVSVAARQASRDRFRAILLTSLTTIAGTAPLLFETSLQAQILVPLVTSLVFGLLASTVAILLMVPAFYTILDDFGWLSFKEFVE